MHGAWENRTFQFRSGVDSFGGWHADILENCLRNVVHSSFALAGWEDRVILVGRSLLLYHSCRM
jgi:hypothetical protein